MSFIILILMTLVFQASAQENNHGILLGNDNERGNYRVAKSDLKLFSTCVARMRAEDEGHRQDFQILIMSCSSSKRIDGFRKSNKFGRTATSFEFDSGLAYLISEMKRFGFQSYSCTPSSKNFGPIEDFPLGGTIPKNSGRKASFEQICFFDKTE